MKQQLHSQTVGPRRALLLNAWSRPLLGLLSFFLGAAGTSPVASLLHRLLRRPVLSSWLAALVFLVGSAGSAVAQTGIFEGYAIISGGSNDRFFDLNGTAPQNTQTTNPDFNGFSIGSFYPSGVLRLGGQV